MRWLWLFLLPVQAGNSQPIETILPALDYNESCQSEIRLQNLADHEASVVIEGHRSDGALVPLEGYSTNRFRLDPGASHSYRLKLESDPGDPWVLVREASSLHQGAAVSVRATTECFAGDKLVTAERRVAFATSNPHYSESSARLKDEVLVIVNASSNPATARVCDGAVGYYWLPDWPGPRSICSTESVLHIPPFGSVRARAGDRLNATFSIDVRGRVAMQALKPLYTGASLYSVDSSITFDGVSGPGPQNK